MYEYWGTCTCKVQYFAMYHMSFVLPITFHLIGKPSTISSTRPAT
jgi:hypothetical protein